MVETAAPPGPRRIDLVGYGTKRLGSRALPSFGYRPMPEALKWHPVLPQKRPFQWLGTVIVRDSSARRAQPVVWSWAGALPGEAATQCATLAGQS